MCCISKVLVQWYSLEQICAKMGDQFINYISNRAFILEASCPRCLSKKCRVKSTYFAICYNCGKWYVARSTGMVTPRQFANMQQRKFYIITRTIKMVNIAASAIILFIILRSFI